MRDLVDLDNRLDANLDGLLLARDTAWNLCANLLEREGLAGIFTAAIVAFSSGNEEWRRRVIDVGISNDLARGLISALGWLDFQHAEVQVDRLLTEKASELRLIGIAGAAVHRRCPPQVVLEGISHADPLLKSRALRAAGELAMRDLVPFANRCLDSDEDSVRFSAAWSCALLDRCPNAITALRSVTESGSLFQDEALDVALRCTEVTAAKEWQQTLSRSRGHLRLAVTAAGVIGDSELMPWLIEQMSQPVSARIAGEAFTMITGVDLAFASLQGEKPVGFDPGPDENPEDENVEMDPDDNLPWPDPELIAKWWGQHHGEFQRGIRYLLGNPISVDWCQQILRKGRQRQRAAAALELAIRQPGQPLFNVAAPGFRQQKILGVR